MFETRTPTGRTRHRLHKPLFGKPMLVLQVELFVQNAWYDGAGPPDYWPDHTMWVDALPEHVTSPEFIESQKGNCPEIVENTKQ